MPQIGPPSHRISLSIDGTNFVVHPKWLNFVVKYPVADGPGSPCGAICNLLPGGGSNVKSAMEALGKLVKKPREKKPSKRAKQNQRPMGDWKGRVRKT